MCFVFFPCQSLNPPPPPNGSIQVGMLYDLIQANSIMFSFQHFCQAGIAKLASTCKYEGLFWFVGLFPFLAATLQKLGNWTGHHGEKCHV